MKKLGSVTDFGPHRNQELWCAYRRALAASGVISPRELYILTATSPTSRFWVSERRAAEVMGAILRGMSLNKMSPTRHEMYTEIFTRFKEYRAKHPGASIYEATFAAVNSPAPKFYLTPGSVRILIYDIRRKRKADSRNLKDSPDERC